MGRKIILLSDGTGNSSAKVWRTNVWRIFESIDLSNSDQVAFYDDGVGTAAFKPLAILGGAFGIGLKRNVIDIYKFACRNYRDDDDQIFGFGFSRGAFTMRLVTGLILDQGLIKTTDERVLHAQAETAYHNFRSNHFRTKWPWFLRPESLYRLIRPLIFRSGYKQADNRQPDNINIRFLGLWDSVAAYGMPIEEMARGISYWIWPWMISDCTLDPRVKRACHALSIDDERTTFHPVLWDERQLEPLRPRSDGKRHLEDEKVSQVWFPGVHSNVGGGYPDDSVARIPLVWIMSEARKCGLAFKTDLSASPQTFAHPLTAQDKDGRIYDPRSGLGGYYRYGPRDIWRQSEELLKREGMQQARPRIHESVLYRIKNRAHSYAPKGLPAHYDVATYSGEVISPDQSGLETEAQALARWNMQERIWNTIVLRRIVYFLTVGVSFWLFIYPVINPPAAALEFETKLRWVSNIIRGLGTFLPPAAAPWLDGYAREPAQFLLVAGILTAMVLWSSRLSSKIQARMDNIWQASVNSKLAPNNPPDDVFYRIRMSAPYKNAHSLFKRVIAPAAFALFFVYLAVTLASHVAFNVQDYAGLVCKKSETPLGQLDRGDYVLENGKTAAFGKLTPEQKRYPFKTIAQLPTFDTSNVCQSMQVKLERGRRYRISLQSTDTFFDADNPARAGFDWHEAATFGQKALFLAATPLRRTLTEPWFRVTVRYGHTGGEEYAIAYDPEEPEYKISALIRPTRNGELFMYVNDAVIGVPGYYNYFYRNNRGSAKVLIHMQ
jgi:uncharacterized protein (DUF2235 family)